METDAFKLSQPRFGEPQSLSTETGKVHLQARLAGRDYLSLVTWKNSPAEWTWGFYNRKLNDKFQNQPEPWRVKTLLHFLKSLPKESLAELRGLLHSKLKALQPIEPVIIEVEKELETQVVPRADAVEVAPEKELEGPWAGHNLIAYFEELNQKYFNNAVQVPVRWSRKSTKKLHSGMTFGVYDFEKQEIRISSRLDKEWVPEYFVKCVIHHEMLHVVVAPKVVDGKTFCHHKEFRMKERTFEDFKKAILWQRSHLKRLLRGK